jgi:hypothetical protein
MKLLKTAAAMAAALYACAAQAEPAHMDHAMSGMEGMDHEGHDMAAQPSFWSSGSGTSRLPGIQGTMSGLHIPAGDWMVMAHGYAWGVYSDQGGPRGDDKAFVQSMGMLGIRSAGQWHPASVTLHGQPRSVDG